MTSEVTCIVAGDQDVSVGDQLSSDGTLYLVVIAVSTSRDLAGDPVLKRAYL